MTLADGGKSEDKEQRWKDEDVDVTASASVGEDVVVELKLSTDECQEELQFFLFRGDLLMPSDRYEIRTRGNVVQLTLKESQKDDAGHYALVAKKLSTGLSIPGDERTESRRKIRLSIQDPSQGFDEGEPPIFVRRLSDLAVKVGTRTRFLVEIRSSTSPKVTWHKNDEPVQSGARFSFVHEGNFYCVDVAPVMVHDQGHWTCMAENGGGRSSCTSVLNVIVPKAYKRPEFVEELQALLTETGTVSLECKVVGVPTPVLKWFKDQKEIKAGDVFALTANPDDPTSLGTYTCEAVNCMGTACSSSKIHVVGKGSREGSMKAADVLRPAGPLPVFKRILCEESCRIGDSLTLSCQVTVPPWPKTITWYNKEGMVQPSEKYHIIEDGLGGYSIEIKGVEAMDEGEWKCVATSSENMEQLSTCYVSMSIPKNYRVPRFMESLKAVLTDEGLVSFECKVVGFPTPLLRWFKDGQELHPGDVYQLTGTNSLGSYCCIARNCMGEAKSTAELTVEDIQNQLNEEERILLMSSNQAPKFVKGLRSCEARIYADFTFTIQVSVSPEPSLSWYRDDVPVIESEKYRLARETLGTCHLEVRKLEFIDQAEWKCVAANDFGHTVTSCFLKLVIPKHFKKPKFLESLRAILSEEGAVNLECKVIGVPQPVLKWYKDGVELKPGDIHRIISGQDGTCCLGTYTCEATNCMGSVSSSASLLGFEDRLSVRKEESKESPLHELARNLSLSTIHEERTSQLYDTPQTDHSITLDDRGEISFSFDGKEVSVSLYETPDLTEEEALQIVEMYADQLSEHITEGNVIELPPMRFTKETSKTGNFLMEALVIDVPPDYFIADDEADDLRTEADVEDVSIMEDQMQSLHSSSYVSSPIAEFPGDRVPSGSPPSRPPRRKESKESPSSKSEKSDKSLQKGFDWSESYHSAKEPSMNTQSSLPGQDDSGEAFTDALSFSGASRSKAEGTKDMIAAYVEETVVKIPLDDENYEETIETPMMEERLVQEVPAKKKRKKKDKKMTKGSRTPSISSKASSEDSCSLEPEERVKRRASRDGKGKGDRRGSASSNKSVDKGRRSRSSSLTGKVEPATATVQQRRESDSTIMVDDIRIEQSENISEMPATKMVEAVLNEDNKYLVEDRPASATSVASTIDSDKSTSRTNKDRILENIYKLSEPIMSLRSALIDLDSLLPSLQTDGNLTNVEISQIEIAKRIVAPVENLCDQVSAIENKALKSAGDRSLAQNVRISLLEAIGGPTEELLRGIELLRRDSDQPRDPKAHLIILESLTDPVDEILVSLSRIEHELSSQETYETVPITLERPIALERMYRAVSHLGTNVQNISDRNLTFGDESTSCSIIERLQSVYQSLDAFLSTVPLSDVTGALENNVDTLVVETLVRPLEELSKNLIVFGTANVENSSERDSIVAGVEKSMSEMRTRLEALIIALDTYEKESGEPGITELHADLVKFLRYTMDDAVERLERLKVTKKRVTRGSRAEEVAAVTPKISDENSGQDGDQQELAMQGIGASSEPEQFNVLQSLVKEAAAIMNIVAVPSIAEAEINETESRLLDEESKLSKTAEYPSTETEEERPVTTEKKKKLKKKKSGEHSGEASSFPKTVDRQPPELDQNLSLPEMLLDPLIDVQANLSDVISDFESQESAEESSLPGSSELAACLSELRECVATAVHTATTLKSENTVNALVDLREPLLDLQLAMASAVSPDEVRLIREATVPLAELKVIVAAAIRSPEASEALQSQMKPVLRMLEDIEAEVAKVSQEEAMHEVTATSPTISEPKETRSIPKRPPEEVERAAVALTGVHFALSTALDRATSFEAEAADSPSLSKQEEHLATAQDIAEQCATSNLMASIEELRQSVGSLAIAIGTPVAASDSNDQYSYDILFDELAKLEEPLLNLQKVLLTEVHGPEDRHVLNDVASPIRSLKEVVQDVTREVGGGSTPIVLELIEDVEKDVSLIAMEALKKALARKSVTSDDDGVASICSDLKPGEVPGIILKWLDPIENWLTSTADEAGELEKEQTTSAIAVVVDDLKRELLKIAIQTSYSEPPSDIALIESLTELQEPLAKVCEVLAECHEPESFGIVEGLIQPTKHLLGTILDASMTHEAGKVLRPVLEAIEELENQIPLTIKRITYEKELQRVVKSMTPEEPETLMADEIPPEMEGTSAQVGIVAHAEVHESSGESSKIAAAVSEMEAGSVESHQVLASKDAIAHQATVERFIIEESGDERPEVTEESAEKEKIEKVESLTETDTADNLLKVTMEGKSQALPEKDIASLQEKTERRKTEGSEQQVDAMSVAEEVVTVEDTVKPKSETSTASIELEHTVDEIAQALPARDSTMIQSGERSSEDSQENTQRLAETVDVKVSKEKPKLSRQVAAVGSQMEDTVTENIQTLAQELSALDQAYVESVEQDNCTRNAEVTGVSVEQNKSEETLNSSAIVTTAPTELQDTVDGVAQTLSQGPSVSLQVQSGSLQTDELLKENPETMSEVETAAEELNLTLEHNTQALYQENASSTQAKLDSSKTELPQELAQESGFSAVRDQSSEMSENLIRSNTIELITVDGRPFVEEVTSLEPQQVAETTPENTNRSEQLDLWTLTLLSPLDRLGEAVLSLDRSLDDEAHVLLCRPLDSLYKQIETAVSQFNRAASQSPENDVETIIEGFLSPVNQLHSALSSAVVVWNVEEPRPVVNELLRAFADSSMELSELLDALRNKLYPQIQRSAQSRQEQQEDASLVETITAVLAPLDNLRNLIETTLKSKRFVDLTQRAMGREVSEDRQPNVAESMATAQEICHKDERMHEQEQLTAQSLEQKAQTREENRLSEALVSTANTFATATEFEKDLEIASTKDVESMELAAVENITESSVQERALSSKPEVAKLIRKEESMDIEEKTAKPLEELIEAIVDSSGPRNVPTSSDGYQSITPDVSDDNFDKGEILIFEERSAGQIGTTQASHTIMSTDNVPIENLEEINVEQMKEDMAQVLVDEILAQAEIATGVKVLKNVQHSLEDRVSTDSLAAESVGEIGISKHEENTTKVLTEENRASVENIEGVVMAKGVQQVVPEDINQSDKAQIARISEANAEIHAPKEAETMQLNIQEGSLGELDDLQMEGATMVTQESLEKAGEGKQKSLVLESSAVSQENIPIEDVEEIVTEGLEEQRAQSRDAGTVAKVSIKDSPEIMFNTRDAEVTETLKVLEEDVKLIAVEKSTEQKAELREHDQFGVADVRDKPEMRAHATDIDISEAQDVLEEQVQERSAEEMPQNVELCEGYNLATASIADTPAIKINTKEADISEISEFPEKNVEEITIEKMDKQKSELREVGNVATAGVIEVSEHVKLSCPLVSTTLEEPEESAKEIAAQELDKREAIIQEGKTLASPSTTEIQESKVKFIDEKVSDTSELREEYVKEFVPETSDEQTAALRQTVSFGIADVAGSPEIEIRAREAGSPTMIQYPDEFVNKSVDEQKAEIKEGDGLAKVDLTDAPEINIKARDALISETSTVLQGTIKDITKQETPMKKAIASIEERQTVQIARIEAEEKIKCREENVIEAAESTIVEIIETPTQKIFKVKEKGAKNGEPDRIVEKTVVKPVEEVIAMEDRHIFETIETPTEKVIKIKLAIEQRNGAVEDVVQEIVIKKPVDGWAKTLVEEEERAISVSVERVQELVSGKGSIGEFADEVAEKQQHSIDEDSKGSSGKSTGSKADKAALALKKENDRSREQEDKANVTTEGQETDAVETNKADELECHDRDKEKLELLEHEKSESLKERRSEKVLKVGDEKIDEDKVDDQGTGGQETERLERVQVQNVEFESAESFTDEEAKRLKRDETESSEREEKKRLEREETERLQRGENERLEREENERLEREEAERIEREEANRLQREEAERLQLEETKRLEREKAERLEREESERRKREDQERVKREEAEREEAERLKREEAQRLEREKAERLEREEAERLEREKAERLEREEAERLEREEAERLEREKAKREEAEHLEREAAERLEREEAKRLEREEAERLEREEAERLEREEAERLERKKAERLERKKVERLEREEAERLEREEAERLEREKAKREEAERLEREEAERLEREEAKRLEREEAERLEREEAERLEREEVERLDREKAKREEAERLEREEAERLEREEAKRLEREEAERLEREEAERLEREEAERLEREEAERLEREEAQRLEREQRERLEREETERLQREEAERVKRVEEEQQRKQEAERLEKEEFDRQAKAREEAERLKLEEMEREKIEEEERLRKAEAEKLMNEERKRQEELEIERVKKEEEEKLRRVEAERIEAEERERHEKLQADRLKQEEDERLRKEEVEKLEKEEREHQEKLKQESERLEKAELERRTQETERLKREQLERVRKEEEERVMKEEEKLKEIEAERLKQEELERAKKEEEERVEEEKRLKQKEFERIRKEEEDRLKKEKAERLKQAELEQIEKEQEEQIKRQAAEKLKQEELERAKKENEERMKEEAERVKLEELERAMEEEKIRVEKEEAERLEKEELERTKQEEKNRLEIEEAERLKQVELERIKKEEEEHMKQKEAERLKLQELERAKKEEEEQKKKDAERVKREELERIKKTEEEERVKKEEAERLKKEELERIKKEEEDRLEKGEAERLEREKLESAKKAEKERLEKEKTARLEKEKLEKEEAARLEKEKLEKEEAARLEKEKLEKEEADRLEIEKLTKQKAARLEEEKLEREKAARLETEKLEKEKAATLENEKLEKEEAARLETEKLEKEKAATLKNEKLEKDKAAKLEMEKLEKETSSKLEGKKSEKDKEEAERSKKKDRKRADKKEVELLKKEESEGVRTEEDARMKSEESDKLEKRRRRRESKDAAQMENNELDDHRKDVDNKRKKNEQEDEQKEKAETVKDEAMPQPDEAESERLKKKESKRREKQEAKRLKKQDSKEDTRRHSKQSNKEEIVSEKTEDKAQAASATKHDDSDDEKTPMNSEHEISNESNKRNVRVHEDTASNRELLSTSTICTDSEIDSAYSESVKSAVSRDEGVPSRRRRSGHEAATEVDYDLSKERSKASAIDRPVVDRMRDDTLSSDDRHYTHYYSVTGRTHEFGPGPRDRGKKPSFCTKLTDRTAAEASRMKLTCTVLGDPEPQVYWTKDGVRLPNSSNRHAITEDNGMVTLEFYSASPKDSGEYSCVAKNLHGQAHTEAKLKVYAGYEPAPAVPTFTRPIKDTYRSIENELVLECRVRGQPSPKITWLKDGQNLEIGDRYRQCDLGDGLCRLKISNPDYYDSGLYTCKAENKSKISDRTSHVVNFEGKGKDHSWRGSYRNLTSTDIDTGRPRFSSYLTDHSVPVGGTIALQVEVKGVPPPDITWMRGDKREPIPSYKARTFADSGIYTLIVPEATESETGTYVCRASNAYGYVDTTANVQVISSGSVEGGKPAMFVSRPAETMIHVTVGEDVSVSFRVNGVPKPRIVWMKGMRDISNGPRSYKESIDDYVRLTLKRALVSDEGTYCILAKNRYGCDRTFYTVKVKQRARSLTPSPDWDSVDTDNLLANIHDTERSYHKQVPGPISSEPVVVDGGRNWLALSWGKAVQHGPAPVVAYRVDAWLLGGEGGARWSELGITPVNAFDAFNLRPGGEYKFRITPRNRYGWGEALTMTSSVTVREIAKFPEFSKILPGQLKALRGETLHLECEVRSDSKADVKWYRDTTDIDGIGDPRYMTYFNGRKSSLTVQAIKEHDSGRYVCEAINPAGRVSTFARVQIVTDPKIVEADEKLRRMRTLEPRNGERPPEFTMRLRDRRVQMTYPVRLTCQVSGHPEPDVTWYKNREEIFQDDNTSFWDDESHFHTLEISHSTIDDSGIYMAKARNVNGMVSCRCNLVVDKGIRAYVAPEFFRHLDAVYTVKAGGELRMSAQIEAYPTVGVVWHRDGHRLRPSRSAVMTLNHDGSVELSLAHVTPRDAGLYCCTATNEVGQTESTTRVTVIGAADDELRSLSQSLPDVVESMDVPYSKEPLFVTKPLSTEAVEGDTVIILCEVVGDPKPEVIWLRDFLRPDYYRDAAHFRRVGAGPQYRLEIPYAKLDFTGAYSVIAKNCHGEAKAIISLQIYARGQGKTDSTMEQASIKHGNVQTLPSIKRPLRDLRCCDGDAVTLICRVHATPQPDVRWEKGGKLVSLGEDFAADFDGETARLSIQHVYPEDEGEYTCVAYNDLGKAFTSACLIVDVPEGKESAISRTLARPIGLLSAESTPISTPRSTPVRSLSPSCATSRREFKHPTGRSSRGQTIGRRPRLPTGPKFYAVPHNRVAEEGETVRFQCAVAGHPTPWVTWDKDGVSVTPTARISLKEKDDVRILEIVEITHEDAGLYRITLENDVGRTEATARLEIIKGRQGSVTRSIRTRSASPRTYSIYSRSPVTSAPRGDTHLRPNIYDSMGGRGGTVSPTPRWHQRNGKPHVESPEPVRKMNKRGTAPARTPLKNGVSAAPKPQNLRVPISTRPRSSSVPKQNSNLRDAPLHLTNARQTKTSDARRATNEAKIRSNKLSSTTVSATNGSMIPTRLPILRSRSPKFSAKHLRGPTKRHEDPVDFQKSTDVKVTVSGDDQSLEASRQAETVESATREIVDEETRETTLLPHDEASPPQKSHEIRREHSENIVEDTMKPRAPVILAAPADVIALRGAKVILRATFDSEPQPRVRWLRKGRDVKHDDKAEIETSRGLTCLTLESVTTEQAGKYAVTLENSAGRDCRYVNVTVEGVPDPPAGAPCVQSITRAGKAIVTWRSPPYDGGCAVTGYSVEMKRNEEPCWIAVAEARHSLSHTVTGLESEETYRFRVRAENAHGVSEPGIVSEAVTVPGENDEEIGGQVFVAEINQIEVEEEDDEFTPAFEARIVSSEDRVKFDERYDIREELGKGRYGIVRRIVEKSTGLNLAAKFVRTIKSKDRQQVYEEIGIMNMLRHPKLLRLAAAFESPKEMIMVTEYISGGELFERVVADDFTLTEKDSIQFVKQICEGVEYMHAHSVVHLDLKPENIMCHTRTSHRIKLIDFGLAQTLKPDTPVRVLLGTPEFIPPEIIGFEPIGTESDMWTVGVICYVLLTGLSPFMGDNDAETFANITRADYDFDDKAFAAISQEAKDFISALLIKRKESRMSAKQCLEHAWLAQRAESMSRVALPTDKLKKFIVRRKWQKTGNAIRALGRMATLSANTRKNLSVDSSPTKTEFGDELFADVMTNVDGFKPIQPTIVIEDRTIIDCQENSGEIVYEEENSNEARQDEFPNANEEPDEQESSSKTEHIPTEEKHSNGLDSEENCPTITELETNEIFEEFKIEDSTPLIQEIDDFIQIETDPKPVNSVTEVRIEELPNEMNTETDLSKNDDVEIINSACFNETSRKLSFSSFVNLEISETGRIEISQSPELDVDRQTKEPSEDSVESETLNEESNMTEVLQIVEPNETLQIKKLEKIVDNGTKTEENEEETKKRSNAVCNEEISNDRETEGHRDTTEKHSVNTKAWCKNNSPVIVDEEDEDARLMERVRPRHIVCTGAVSRTAKMFEKEEEANSLSQRQQHSVNRTTATVPEARPQNERIRKAFAFWNQ